MFPPLFFNSLFLLFLTLFLHGGCPLEENYSVAHSDLPACGDYGFQSGWFKIYDFQGVVMDFQVQYYDQEGFIPCTVSIADKDLDVWCEKWSFLATWLEPGRNFPLVDGQEVYVLAGDFGMFGKYYIWVVDKVDDQNGETLFYQADDLNYESGPLEIDNHKLKLSGYEYCEYRNPDALPPSWSRDPYEDWDWEYVLGYNAFGYVEDTEFDVYPPGRTMLSDDGKYYLILPYSYGGRTSEWDPDADYDGSSLRTLFQIVRAQ